MNVLAQLSLRPFVCAQPGMLSAAPSSLPHVRCRQSSHDKHHKHLCRAIEQVLPGALDVMAMFSHPKTHVWQSLAWEFLDTCIGRAADRPLLGPGIPPPPYFVKPPADDLWSEAPVESAPAPG